ncbi:hypothetical protein KIPB_009981 [Kipferlia bialata]|uniref:Uncharacterized protein n=1 Tax=Kipferlia bialata TaxID=797122 RepID=A0A391NP92_9EUKA|nr:hypothetical protein KIPB_009981 [Kipferlia bialata]|eukprot:g9981.t1
MDILSAKYVLEALILVLTVTEAFCAQFLVADRFDYSFVYFVLLGYSFVQTLVGVISLDGVSGGSLIPTVACVTTECLQCVLFLVLCDWSLPAKVV